RVKRNARKDRGLSHLTAVMGLPAGGFASGSLNGFSPSSAGRPRDRLFSEEPGLSTWMLSTASHFPWHLSEPTPILPRRISRFSSIPGVADRSLSHPFPRPPPRPRAQWPARRYGR